MQAQPPRVMPSWLHHLHHGCRNPLAGTVWEPGRQIVEALERVSLQQSTSMTEQRASVAEEDGGTEG